MLVVAFVVVHLVAAFGSFVPDLSLRIELLPGNKHSVLCLPLLELVDELSFIEKTILFGAVFFVFESLYLSDVHVLSDKLLAEHVRGCIVRLDVKVSGFKTTTRLM